MQLKEVVVSGEKVKGISIKLKLPKEEFVEVKMFGNLLCPIRASQRMELGSPKNKDRFFNIYTT